ncbi:TPR_REGION domain-containing protein [Caenorhabditis elegans]|uniref:TPR_REGION domain-containing protein n=2 Tax=Caenorhabditis elegans TaxID=6239 RepID=A0A0K3AUB2_CAEEL|nr:TPR_REGION domain-containing protein [Caenorhabditis elegans]CTQ86629.1 TPR_REGION domain-containing protein [Caenorhabditis elegans]|eukprot:NP_001299929.1 Uncharacterized protein CELE_ZK1236.9 [Caenorhabditis elegans]
MNDMMSSMNSSSYFESFSDSTMNEPNNRFVGSRPATSGSFNKEGTPTTPNLFSLSNSEERISQFTLPNYVEQPTSSINQQTGRVVKKAQGEVDLSGEELMPFLYKAAERLREMKDKQTKAEGIKLRFGSLAKLISEEKLSDELIKSLNYVVDSLEFEKYQEAMNYYDQFCKKIPNEIAKSWYWLSSLKMLINELNVSRRGGSAGSHLRSL